MQLGDFNRRLRRSISFVVGAIAVIVALALMAVADGGPAIPGGQASIGRLPRSDPPPPVISVTPLARPRPTPETSRPPAVDVPPETVLVGSVGRALPSDPPRFGPPTTEPLPISPAPVRVGRPTRKPRRATPPTVPPTTTPPTTTPPTTGPPVSGGPDYGGDGISCGRRSGETRPGRGRRERRPSRSDAPRPRRGTPASSRPR